MIRQFRLPFYLAFQYIRRGRKWTLLLTIFLMTVAFINLIFMPALFNGIIDGANKQIIDTMTGDIFVSPLEGQDYINDKEKNLSQIRSVHGVEAASARLLVPARLKYKNITGNWQVSAVNPYDEKKVSNVDNNIISGSYLSPDDEDKIVIGIQIAGGKDVEENTFSFKGAKVGDKLKMIFDGKSKEFTIKGIFKTKFVDSDKRAFISQRAIEKIMPLTIHKANTINIKLNKTVNQGDAIDELKAKNINGQIFSWKEAAGIMKSISSSFFSINVLLSFTSVLIAAVTILIIIYVTIINKRKEIGILRAIGIKPYIIVSSYVILSAVYSIVGIIIGTIVFSAIIMPYFQSHPFSLPICDAVLVPSWADYIIRVESIIWVSIFSGLVPAIIVTRTRMLDAILGK